MFCIPEPPLVTLDRKLRKAIQAGDAVEAVAVLADGASVHVVDIHGRTPLHAASRADLGFHCIDVLIAHGAVVDARDGWGHAPLHSAVLSGPVEAVIALLKHGAQADVEVNRLYSVVGNTPLQYVPYRIAEADVPVIIKHLLAAGADLNRSYNTELFNTRGRRTQAMPVTPLVSSALLGSLITVKELIAQGARLPSTSDLWYMESISSNRESLAEIRKAIAWLSSLRCGWISACVQGGFASS
jgi:ankyrin repeat protein